MFVVYAIHQYEGIFLRKYKWKFFIILVLGFSSLLINYQYISYSTKDLIFDDFNTATQKASELLKSTKYEIEG